MITNKRIIAVLLAAFMVLGMLPAAFAADYKLDLLEKPSAAETSEPAEDEETAAEGEEHTEEEEILWPEYAEMPESVRYNDIVHVRNGELPAYILRISPYGADILREIPAGVPEYRITVDFDQPDDTYTVMTTVSSHPLYDENDEESPYKGDYTGIVFFLDPRPHTHSAAAEWNADETGHYKLCTNDDGNCTAPRMEFAAHECESDGICTVCGYGTNAVDGAAAEMTGDAVDAPETGTAAGEAPEADAAASEAPEAEAAAGEVPEAGAAPEADAAEGAAPEADAAEGEAPEAEAAAGEVPEADAAAGEAPEAEAAAGEVPEADAAAGGVPETGAAAEESKSTEDAPEAEHTFTVIWSGNSSHHWHVCTAAECTLDYTNLSEEEKELASFGEHEYGTDGDARFTCSRCGSANEERKAVYEHEDLVNAVCNSAAAARNEITAMKVLSEDQKTAAFSTIADIEHMALDEIEAAPDYETAAAVKDKALADIAAVIGPIRLEAAREEAKQSLEQAAGSDTSSLVSIALEEALAAIDACESVETIEEIRSAAESAIREYVAFNSQKEEYVQSIAESVNENDSLEAHKIAAAAEETVATLIYNKELTLEENLAELRELWVQGKVDILKKKAADGTLTALSNVTVGISTNVSATLSGTKSQVTNMLICSPAMSEDVVRAIAIGQAVKLVVSVKDNPSPDPVERDLIVKAATGFQLVKWLDISLYATLDGTDYPIPETAGKITINLKVASGLISSDPTITRTYIVGRAHNNIADLISPSFSKTNTTLTIQTDKFSTYAYGYKDSSGGGGNVPQTGDDSMPVLWLVLMGISIAGLGGIAIRVRRKNKT